jgi:predicted ATPase
MRLLNTAYPKRKGSFFKCINKFREDHDRRLSWLPDTSCSSDKPVVLPDGLSCGERRLLEILGTVMMLPESKPGVVLIDDPELHLHLAWQEILVDTLREIRPKAQFIFATHAPSIVARNNYMDHCINITKARRSE